MRRGRHALCGALLLVVVVGCSEAASTPLSDGVGADTETRMESPGGLPAAAGPLADPNGVAGEDAVGAQMAAASDAGTRHEAGAEDGSDPAADAGLAEAGAECDASGIWIARMLTVISALGLEQCGNRYDYFELRQTGSEIEVIDHLSCGFEDRGSVTRRPTEAAARAMLGSNSQIGRKGTMAKGADGLCQLTMEPYWAVWGVDEESYVPQPRNSPQPLHEVSRANPLPRDGDGVLDPDGDGRPGMSIEIRGALSVDGQIILRSVHHWVTDDRYPITPAAAWADDIEVHANHTSEEHLLEPANDGAIIGPIQPVSQGGPASRVTLRFLGRDASDPRVTALVASADPDDEDDALQTCRNIIAALPPIEPLFGDAQRCPCPGGAACDAP